MLIVSKFNNKWVKRWFDLAKVYASFSEDSSTKVGCIVVGDDNDQKSEGWNGLPRGISLTEENSTRPSKYLYFEHAERNAIYNASRKGVSLKDSSIFVTQFPCADCARGIIQSGIKTVYTLENFGSKTWEESNKASLSMFREAGVQIWYIPDNFI